jgi:dihydroorotase
MSVLIKNATVVNGTQQKKRDVFIDNGIFERVDTRIQRKATRVIDAHGLFLIPGLIDLHAHLRVPSEEREETIATATAAAARGGITTVVAMPNTQPCIDDESVAEWLSQQIKKEARVQVLIAGALTKGLEGRQLAPFAELQQQGCVAFTDDGTWLANGFLMRRALEYTRMLNVPVFSHCQVPELSDGLAYEGAYATQWGLPAIDRASEAIAVARDIMLAQEVGARLHILHVSTAASVDVIKALRSKQRHVTCEVTPHHLVLDVRALGGFNPCFKVNPPLGNPDDRKALQKALKKGIIDTIGTDHAPHTLRKKDMDLIHAAPGTIGLQTALPVLYTDFVAQGIISMQNVVQMFSVNPAKVLGLSNKGVIEQGRDADCVLFDCNKQWVMTEDAIVSMSRNSVFLGKQFAAAVVATFVKGKEVYSSL